MNESFLTRVSVLHECLCHIGHVSHEQVMSHWISQVKWMNHVPHEWVWYVSASCHASHVSHEKVVSHWISQVTRMTHVSHEWVCYMRASCHISHVTLHCTGRVSLLFECVMSHMSESVVSHMSESIIWVRHVTHEWVYYFSASCHSSPVTLRFTGRMKESWYTNESCHTWGSHVT